MTELAPVAEVQLEVQRRMIRVRLSGVMTSGVLERFCTDYLKATDAFGGEAHVVLADMRGLRTLPRELAEVFGAMIAEARGRGVALCAHVSDQTVQRMQAGRLARSVSPGDDVTVDCASVEEALSVCREAELELRRGGPQSLMATVLSGYGTRA